MQRCAAVSSGTLGQVESDETMFPEEFADPRETSDSEAPPLGLEPRT